MNSLQSKLIELSDPTKGKVKFQEDETSSGIIAEVLKIPACKVSLALSKLSNAPKPVRIQGKVRLYSIDEISNWISKLGGIPKASVTISRINQNRQYGVSKKLRVSSTKAKLLWITKQLSQ